MHNTLPVIRDNIKRCSRLYAIANSVPNVVFYDEERD